MNITLHTFGIAREICGGSVVKMDVPDALNAGALKSILLERFPQLGNLTSFLLAVNAEFAEASTPIQSTDELALIPPVSGG